MEDEKAVPAEAAEETKEQITEEQTTEEAVPEKAETPEVAEVTPEPKKKTAQERIDEITRARREAEREREYWKRVALEKDKEAPREEARPTVQAIPARPTLDQFETTVAYEDALFEWRDQVREIQTQVKRRQEEQSEALNSFQQRAEALRKEYEDFDEVIETPVFSPVMREALLHSENGPLMAYHLGLPENRAIADRIRKLPERAQAYEIGKLESQVLLARNTRKVPGAPAPLKPVGMSGSGGDVDESKLSDDDWYRLEQQRIKEKLRKKIGG